MREAAKKLGNYRLNGSSFFVTLEPCAMCAGAMIHARPDRLVFAAADPKAGACALVLSVLITHSSTIRCGSSRESWPMRPQSCCEVSFANGAPSSFALALECALPGSAISRLALHRSHCDSRRNRTLALRCNPTMPLVRCRSVAFPCHTPAGTTNCTCCPAARSGPRVKSAERRGMQFAASPPDR